ncbi:T9SS type A sorting domain-containing protein [Flavobacterium sp.]|uniref:T9SS type A sorting domain-containing protein n=1 Tax=Flavobacterium sp. TaxID=239 RepID=UPI00286D7972|nr:T9SS type A sorting domain-containing protein [Flavobacterium sp.]
MTSSSATGNVWSTGATTQSISVSTGGNYTVAVTSGGCTSATSAGTTVTINPSPDAGVTLNLGVLQAIQTGATYQWYQCGTPDVLLTGETNRSYTPTVAGLYEVVITLGGCTVTSTCVDVVTLGNENFELFSKFNLYPNPNSGIVNIDSDTNGDLLIFNQLGQVVRTFTIKANVVNAINIDELSDGTYFVKGTKGINISTQKLVIKK